MSTSTAVSWCRSTGAHSGWRRTRGPSRSSGCWRRRAPRTSPWRCRNRADVSTLRRLRNSSRGGDPTISRDSPNRKLPTDKGRNMGFLDKAKDLVAQNADTVDSAIDKASEFVDSKTDGKFKDTVNQVQEAAKNALKDGKKEDQ